MKLMTRTKFLGTGIASVGGAAGLLRDPAIAAAALPLDASYQRPDTPKAAVSYPSGWNLYPNLITDLTAPAELFSISNQTLKPGPSMDESGLPDVSVLDDASVLITILAQTLGDGSYAAGPSISVGMSIDRLAKVASPSANVDQRSGWYLDTTIGYLVLVWNGHGSADLLTADAILGSFRPPTEA